MFKKQLRGSEVKKSLEQHSVARLEKVRGKIIEEVYTMVKTLGFVL